MSFSMRSERMQESDEVTDTVSEKALRGLMRSAPWICLSSSTFLYLKGSRSTRMRSAKELFPFVNFINIHVFFGTKFCEPHDSLVHFIMWWNRQMKTKLEPIHDRGQHRMSYMRESFPHPKKAPAALSFVSNAWRSHYVKISAGAGEAKILSTRIATTLSAPCDNFLIQAL